MSVYAIRQTEEFLDWLDKLSDRRAQVRIAARLRYAERGNLGDWKPVGGNVSEMRMDVGPGYRLYFTHRQKTILVMLIGGDKSTQGRDIIRARDIATKLERDS